MKAIVNKKFGPPSKLEIKEIDKPVPQANEVLIKTHATSVNTIDVVFRNGLKAIFGLARITTGIRKPRKKVLGFDVSGEIVELGENVTDFQIGDLVYGGAKSGANAEYTTAKSPAIAKKPANMSHLEAGAIPIAGLSALQGLRGGNIQEGQTVLIYGASGGIGTYAVQLAKNYSTTVTGVASGKNEQLVRNLGADDFIDYKKEDFTTKGDKYDLIFDTVAKSPLSRWKKALKDHGIFINAGSPHMSMVQFIIAQMGNKFRKKKYKGFSTVYLKEDLEYLAKLAEQGKLKSVIDKTYSFEEMSIAHEYYEKGHTAGKVV
ncbi:MAG: NAD(P)-dependent alcohol dehydrogenase, partial [Candidatus Hodarchaeota archaeon]